MQCCKEVEARPFRRFTERQIESVEKGVERLNFSDALKGVAEIAEILAIDLACRESA